MIDAYERDGYVILRDQIPKASLDELEDAFLTLARDRSGLSFKTTNDPDLCALVAGDRALEQTLYTEVRDFPWLTSFSSDPQITDPVKQLIGDEIAMFAKIPLRIDVPLVTRELAVWHQDHHYVRGNTQTLTAWIPLQDTPYELGCLMVMPGSHKLGTVAHDKTLLGKKQIPSNRSIYEREVRYVEMERGDLLLFNALLLHSSGNNLSDRLRLSVQARYTPINLPTNPNMGQLIRV